MRDRDRRDYRDPDYEDRRPDGISEREAIRIARHVGLRDVDSVTARRRIYRIDGGDRHGDDIRVIIDRYSGEVLAVR